MKHLMSVSKDLARGTDPLKAAKGGKGTGDSIFKTPEQKGVTSRKNPVKTTTSKK